MTPPRFDVRSRGIALLLTLALVVAAVPGLAAAQESERAGGTVIVGEDETVDGLEAFAGTVIVRGTVAGDASAVAGTVVVAESGRVEGDLEAAAGSVRIAGTVTGDVQAAGGSVEVAESGRIGGDLETGAGYLSVAGQVDGSIRAGVETLVVGPNASVGGDLRYDAETADVADGAAIEGQVIEDASLGGDLGPGFASLTVDRWVSAVYGLLANLVLGAVLLAVFPTFSAGVADRVADAPVTSGGVGLLALIAIPVLIAVFAITIIGIPIAILGALAFGLAVWVGVVYGQYAVGAWAIGLTDRENRWLALVVGLVGFALLSLIPILGGLLEFLALLLGFGALWIALRDAYRGRRGRRTADERAERTDDSAGDASTTA